MKSLPFAAFIVIILVVKWLWKWYSLYSADDPKRMAPYPAQPIKGRKKYHVMMDVRKLDQRNWLTIDKNYMAEHQVRNDLLRNERSRVIQCLPESQEACKEALEEVVAFLCERFPGMFEKKQRGGEMTVLNKKTGEKFLFGESKEMEPLEIAVRLTMEDLSILMTNEDGEYYLYATAPPENIPPTQWLTIRAEQQAQLSSP